ISPIGRSMLDDNTATFHVTERAKAITEGAHTQPMRGGAQETDAVDLCRLLRTRRERPCRHPADHLDELPPPHPITSAQPSIGEQDISSQRSAHGNAASQCAKVREVSNGSKSTLAVSAYGSKIPRADQGYDPAVGLTQDVWRRSALTNDDLKP